MEVGGHDAVSSGIASAVSGPPARVRRPFLVTLGITATVLLSVFSVGVLYYKWYRQGDTSSLIIVWGDPSWEGAIATVSSSDLPTPGFISRQFEANDKGMIRFHVPPGSYFVRVSRDNQTIAQRVTDRNRPLQARTIWWPFHAPPVVTQPSPAQQ